MDILSNIDDRKFDDRNIYYNDIFDDTHWDILILNWAREWYLLHDVECNHREYVIDPF
jgi:hypothetical protein